MADAENRPSQPGHPAARVLWLFQALIAGFLCVLWGQDLFWEVSYPYHGATAYPILKELFLAVLAAMVVYAVIVQSQWPDPPPRVTARLELAKGLLATAVWIWVLLDAIFYVSSDDYRWDPYFRSRSIRIVFSAASFVILCTCCPGQSPLVYDVSQLTAHLGIFFYPAVFWSARLARQAEEQETAAQETAVQDDAAADEDTPLLRGE